MSEKNKRTIEDLKNLFPKNQIYNKFLVEVFLRTVEIIRDGEYEVFGQKRPIDIHPPLKRSKKWTVMFESIPKLLPHLCPQLPAPKVYVENIDTLEKAMEFGTDGACLNMASGWTPGGGVLKGSRAQEEDLCRRSTLAWSLFRYGTEAHRELLKIKREGFQKYPLSTYGCIWSPCIAVIKDRNYNLLREPGEINVISAAAIRNPELDPRTGEMSTEDCGVVAEKIRSVLRCAAIKGIRKLVLGAWGCGAYHNPPETIAIIFDCVLKEEEFKGWFSEICFAILDDHNSPRGGNFAVFKNMFLDDK